MSWPTLGDGEAVDGLGVEPAAITPKLKLMLAPFVSMPIVAATPKPTAVATTVATATATMTAEHAESYLRDREAVRSAKLNRPGKIGDHYCTNPYMIYDIPCTPANSNRYLFRRGSYENDASRRLRTLMGSVPPQSDPQGRAQWVISVYEQVSRAFDDTNIFPGFLQFPEDNPVNQVRAQWGPALARLGYEVDKNKSYAGSRSPGCKTNTIKGGMAIRPRGVFATLRGGSAEHVGDPEFGTYHGSNYAPIISVPRPGGVSENAWKNMSPSAKLTTYFTKLPMDFYPTTGSKSCPVSNWRRFPIIPASGCRGDRGGFTYLYVGGNQQIALAKAWANLILSTPFEYWVESGLRAWIDHLESLPSEHLDMSAKQIVLRVKSDADEALSEHTASMTSTSDLYGPVVSGFMSVLNAFVNAIGAAVGGYACPFSPIKRDILSCSLAVSEAGTRGAERDVGNISALLKHGLSPNQWTDMRSSGEEAPEAGLTDEGDLEGDGSNKFKKVAQVAAIAGGGVLALALARRAFTGGI